MRTLPELVKAHIDRKAALAFDPEAIIREAKEAETRMKQRIKNDPSLYTYVSHYTDGMLAALKMIPEPMKPLMIRELLAEIIIEWEDINRAFEEQLKPMA